MRLLGLCILLGGTLCRLPGGDVVRVVATAWVDARGRCTLGLEGGGVGRRLRLPFGQPLGFLRLVALAQRCLQISREVDDRAIDGLRLSLQLACLLCLAQSLRCSLVEVLADAAALACAPLDGGRSWPKVGSSQNSENKAR